MDKNPAAYYFYDSSLHKQVVNEPLDGIEPAPCEFDDIDITLGSTISGEPAIIFYRPEDWSMLGYIYKHDGELRKVYTYIQDNRDYLFRITDGDKCGKIICNHTPNQLHSVRKDYSRSDKADMYIQSRTFIDYNSVSLYDVEELVLMDKTSNIMSIKHSEDDGKHVYTVEMISCEAGPEVLPLQSQYSMDVAAFEQHIFKVYPGVKYLISKVEISTDTLDKVYMTI